MVQEAGWLGQNHRAGEGQTQGQTQWSRLLLSIPAARAQSPGGSESCSEDVVTSSHQRDLWGPEQQPADSLGSLCLLCTKNHRPWSEGSLGYSVSTHPGTLMLLGAASHISL